MACSISTGLTITCDSLKRVGGLNKDLWLFNLSDLATPIVAVTDGYVTNVPLSTYRTLYKIQGTKFAHSFEINEQRSDEGLVQWEHKLMLKVMNSNPTDDALLEDLTVGEFGGIVRTNNNEFLILGAQNGMTSTEAKLQSGQKSGDSSASTITLTGNEQSVYKRLLIGGSVNNTIAYLNAATA